MEYQDKHDLIYDTLGCSKDVKIPLNDQQAWLRNEKYRDLYNRQKLAEFQDLYHAMMPIRPSPEKYPVILKPVVNLYGMGHHCYVMRNEDDFWRQWSHTGFWCEILEGSHKSYDLLIKDGQIKWHTCFEGFYQLDKKGNKQPGVFDYWEGLPDEKLPLIIKRLVKEKLENYTGCLNVECIDDRIIECHLRVGDLDRFPDQRIMVEVIRLYRNQDWSLSEKYKPAKVYMIPVWGRKSIRNKLVTQQVIEICQKSKILTYQMDQGESAPPGKKRLFLLTGTDYDEIKSTKETLIELLSKFGYTGLT